MADFSINPFPDPGNMTLVQIFFMTILYGYVLLQASALISTGSELLLLVPRYAPFVGSVVLPILGAVPDGMMVLVSGLGPDAQNEVAVGVGALAGSTIMLLTLPWFLAVLSGRVSVKDGNLNYRRPAGEGDNWQKLKPEHQWSLFNSAVSIGPEIKTGAKMMLATLLGYVVIQGSAFTVDEPGSKPNPITPAESHEDIKRESRFENPFALAGLIICVLEFIYYLYDQSKSAGHSEGLVDNMIAEKHVDAIKEGQITLRGAMVRFRGSSWASTCQSGDLEQALLAPDAKNEVKRMCKILAPFFEMYDSDGNKQIDFEEFRLIFRDVNENLSKEFQQQMFAAADADSSGSISFEEFVACMISFSLDEHNDLRQQPRNSVRAEPVKYVNVADSASDVDGSQKGGSDEEEDEEEEEDIPDDLAGLSPEEQQFRIKTRALYQMGIGTVLVIAFSDPMVDLLGEIGLRLGVPAFYISFVLAPLASNSPELVASYNYAKKRTIKSIVTSLAQLEGAAIMNNTFCLAIFLALVYFKRLAWEFSAETISIMAIQVVLGVMVSVRSKQRLVEAFFVLSLYPMSLGLVWVLENKFGWD